MSFDPFSLAGADITPGREIVLNGYWLAQLLMYLIHEISGDYGLVFLRVLLMLIPPVTVLVYGLRKNVHPTVILLLGAFLPKTDAGTTVGAAIAAAVDLIKSLLFIMPGPPAF